MFHAYINEQTLQLDSKVLKVPIDRMLFTKKAIHEKSRCIKLDAAAFLSVLVRCNSIGSLHSTEAH